MKIIQNAEKLVHHQGTPKQLSDFLTHEFAKTVMRGFNPQYICENPVCAKCKTLVKMVFTESKHFGTLGLIPSECNECKRKAYEVQLQGQMEESYKTRIYRCGGNQNRLQKHDNVLVKIEDLVNVGDNQKELFEHIFNYLSGTEIKGLLLLGGVGTGKTLFIKILNNELVKSFRDVCFIKAVDLALLFRNFSFKNPKMIEEFKNVDTLIIDDFGTQKNTDFIKEMIFSIIDYRYENKKKTFITSNLDQDDLRESDNRVFSRLCDREWLNGMKIMGKDYRQSK